MQSKNQPISFWEQNKVNYYPINFLWVGPPKKSDDVLFAHDVAGPIAVANQIVKQYGTSENHVRFWCLSKYKAFYLDFFSQHNAKIKVLEIEDHLNTLANSEANSATCIAAREFLQYLAIPKNDNTTTWVTIKDGFSLFLLMSEVGYIADTNNLPKIRNDQHQLIDLSTSKKISPDIFGGDPQILTAPCSYGGASCYDFYFMLSKQKESPVAIQIFQKWITEPAMDQTSVFNLVTNEMNIIIMPALNLEKCSFKSYSRQISYSIPTMIAEHDSTALNAFLPFNQLKKVPSGKITLLQQTSFATYKNSLNNKTALLADSIATDSAYVLEIHKSGFDGPKKLFYFDRKKGNLTLIFDMPGVSCYSFFERCFPILGLVNELAVKVVDQKELNDLYDFLNTNNNQFLLSIPRIINLSEESLLHYAARCDNPFAINKLLEVNTDRDLKVTYMLMPENQTHEFTFEQLVSFLKLENNKNVSSLQPKSDNSVTQEHTETQESCCII